MAQDASSHSNLQMELIKALESLIQNPGRFKQEFKAELLEIDRGSKKDDLEKRHNYIFDHIYQTIKNAIDLINTNEIKNTDYAIVFDILFNLTTAFPIITRFSERSHDIQQLTLHCLKQLSQKPAPRYRSGGRN